MKATKVLLIAVLTGCILNGKNEVKEFRISEINEYYYSNSDSLVKWSDTKFQYDNENRVKEIVEIFYNDDYDSTKTEFIYGATKFPTEAIFSYYQNNVAYLNEKYEYDFQNEKLIQKKGHVFHNGSWIPISSHAYIYQGENLIRKEYIDSVGRSRSTNYEFLNNKLSRVLLENTGVLDEVYLSYSNDGLLLKYEKFRNENGGNLRILQLDTIIYLNNLEINYIGYSWDPVKALDTKTILKFEAKNGNFEKMMNAINVFSYKTRLIHE